MSSYGLNQAARNAAARAEKAEAAKPPPLNVPFPFRKLAFQPQFFGIVAVPVAPVNPAN